MGYFKARNCQPLTKLELDHSFRLTITIYFFINFRERPHILRCLNIIKEYGLSSGMSITIIQSPNIWYVIHLYSYQLSIMNNWLLCYPIVIGRGTQYPYGNPLIKKTLIPSSIHKQKKNIFENFLFSLACITQSISGSPTTKIWVIMWFGLYVFCDKCTYMWNSIYMYITWWNIIQVLSKYVCAFRCLLVSH